jgi:hypothetical protein
VLKQQLPAAGAAGTAALPPAPAAPGALVDMPSRSLNMYLERARSPKAWLHAWGLPAPALAPAPAACKSHGGSPPHSPPLASPTSAPAAAAPPAAAPARGAEERLALLQRIYGGPLQQLPFSEALRSGLSRAHDAKAVEEVLQRLLLANPKLNW